MPRENIKSTNEAQVLANDPVANSYWFLTEDKTIASGTTFTIPANVTIVPNGGIIKGSGTLVGTNTRIEAGFVQVFDVNLTISGTWNVGLAHPEWFGEPDKAGTSSKDCLRIQKAIDLITVSFNDPILKSGKVECRPGNEYHIAQPIILRDGHSFDGGQSTFHYKISDGGKYMFRLDPLNEMAARSGLTTISNLRLVNGQSAASAIVNAYGIYCGCQMCTFENIYTDRLYQTFQRVNQITSGGTTQTPYLDQITLRNFVVSRPMGNKDKWLIDMGNIGDNLLIDNIHVHSPQQNDQLLKVNGCGGGLVQRIINGTIYIKDSKGMILSAVHQEFGNIKIENTQIEINGLSHFKKPTQYAIGVFERSANVNEHRTVAIKNSLIVYNHMTNSFVDENDVYINGAGSVKIENVYRVAQMEWTSASSLYGIRIKENASFSQNQAIHSLNSYICGKGTGGQYDYTCAINDFVSYYRAPDKEVFGTCVQSPNGFEAYKSRDVINTTIWTRSNINQMFKLKYTADVLFDKGRNLGVYNNSYPLCEEIKVTNDVYAVRIRFSRYYYSGVIIRLYRTNLTTGVKHYIDIPVGTSNNYYYDFYDRGMFGDSWIEIEDADNFPNIQTCSSYQSFGLNVMVSMQSRPTSGTWMKGDIINLPNERLIYGYNFTI